jgi:hypothetical protein
MVEVIVTHKLVRVKAPYHPEFPSLARMMQGDWDKATKRWTFPADMEENVRELLRDIYGTDSDDYEAVHVRYRVCRSDADRKEVYRLGRKLMSRKKFNEEVRLGKHVTVVEGMFPRKCGTPVKARIGGEGTWLRVEDVPRILAEELVRDAPGSIVIE